MYRLWYLLPPAATAFPALGNHHWLAPGCIYAGAAGCTTQHVIDMESRHIWRLLHTLMQPLPRVTLEGQPEGCTYPVPFMGTPPVAPAFLVNHKEEMEVDLSGVRPMPHD